MPALPTNTKLYMPCDGADGSTTFTDTTGRHSFSRNGDAQIDTAQSKFGGASLLLDGTGDSLYSADSADWDICANTSEDWTISLWAKHSVHSGVEVYASQYQGTGDYWSLFHSHANGLYFYVRSGSTDIITSGYGGEITDTNWHHLLLFKKGGVTPIYGVYKDGAQVIYVADSSTASFAGSFYIGETGNSANYVNGWLDDIMICQSNPFGANPDSGKTDTITVPTAPWGTGILNGIMVLQS